MFDYDDPWLEGYLEHAKHDTIPKMRSSAVNLVILKGDPDPKLCLELGASILLDVPIIVVVPDSATKVPHNVRRVASIVLRGDPQDPGFRPILEKAIREIQKNDLRTKKPT